MAIEDAYDADDRITPAPIRGASIAEQYAVTVVRCWKDHGHYPTRNMALASLESVTPTMTVVERAALLDAVAEMHDRAIAVVPRHVRRRRWKLLPFATAGDIDVDGCLVELDQVAPDLSDKVKRYILGWVIHWYWVR